jgi:hypothetical protein
VRRYVIGAVAGIGLAALIVGALLLFTDLRVTDQSPSEEAAQLLVEDGQSVQRCCGKPLSVTVPDVVGRTVHDAKEALKGEGLQIRFESPRLGKDKALGPRAVVSGQNPQGGTRASRGLTVTLFIHPE